MTRSGPDNEEIAEVLERLAELLETQDADGFRVRAYRNAARTVRTVPRPLRSLLEEGGTRALVRLPAIGRTIAAQIREIVHTGRLAMLERLEGQVSPEDLFTTVPGIGEGLARRIHDELGIETLEELELAAHDGRLEALRGFGAGRLRGVRDALAGRLGRGARRRARVRRWLETHGRPDVETVLAVDAEYRAGAEEGTLPTLAPRRFNPDGQAWLPILHSDRDGWSFTALFSNTARAHRLGASRDWVVLYYERDGEEDQCTVVTEKVGPLRGRRVVRGREAECARLYARRDPALRAAWEVGP